MITYKDIKLAVNNQLSKTGIEINSNDVKEGFSRPSFFVRLDNPGRSGDENQVHKSMTVRINFFPTSRDEYSIEVLEMQETLEGLFDLKLPVKDRLFNVDEFNSIVNDGVLNASFDLAFYDGRASDKTIIDDLVNGEEFRKKHPIEKMESLEFEKVEE